MIPAIDQEASDIDWFFTNGEQIGFVASGGGKLPDVVALLDEKLDNLVNYFHNLPYLCNAKIIDNGKDNDADLSSWIKMAERGLFAYDKTVLNNFTDPDYHLIAVPLNPLKTNDLPPEITTILRSITIDFEMDRPLNIRLFDKR